MAITSKTTQNNVQSYGLTNIVERILGKRRKGMVAIIKSTVFRNWLFIQI